MCILPFPPFPGRLFPPSLSPHLPLPRSHEGGGGGGALEEEEQSARRGRHGQWRETQQAGREAGEERVEHIDHINTNKGQNAMLVHKYLKKTF